MSTTSGELVLDDELIGSQACGIEMKSKSERKAGKDGPEADAIADAHTGCLHGMPLHVKGEGELENVLKLFEWFPSPTSVLHDVAIEFNRGYGKIKTLIAVGSKGYCM
jgi:hypothetical protein